MTKILNLKLVIISEFLNTKIFLLKDAHQVFAVIKIKSTFPWAYVINDLNSEEIIGIFYEKELQKTNQRESRIEKILWSKGDKLYVKWKGQSSSFNS